MSRVTWFAAGAATGVYALLRARSTARNFTPDGVAARAAALAAGWRVFASEVSAGMVEKEAELRDQLAAPRLGPPSVVPAMIERHLDRPDDPMERRADGHR